MGIAAAGVDDDDDRCWSIVGDNRNGIDVHNVGYDPYVLRPRIRTSK